MTKVSCVSYGGAGGGGKTMEMWQWWWRKENYRNIKKQTWEEEK